MRLIRRPARHGKPRELATFDACACALCWVWGAGDSKAGKPAEVVMDVGGRHELRMTPAEARAAALRLARMADELESWAK